MTLFIVLILGAGAFVQGFFGFGFGALGVALLTLELPTKEAVAQIVSVAPLSTITAALLQRREIRYHGIIPLALGALVCFPAGVAILFLAPEWSLQLTLGVLVVTTAVMELLPGTVRLLPPGPVGGTLASILSGLSGGAIGVPGLTMTAYIYAREEDPNVARASLQFFFLFTTVVLTTTHAVAGTIRLATLRNALIAAPAVLLGVSSGITLARKVPHRHLEKVYALGLGALGVYTMVRVFA